MKRIKRTAFGVAALAVVALLGACANPYEQHYKPYPTPSVSIAFIEQAGAPQMSIGSGDTLKDLSMMYERGYGLVGSAIFVRRFEPSASAFEQAKAVGADFVLVSSKYQSTATDVMSITTPTTTTTFHSGMVSIPGAGGLGSASYSGTTTTHGTKTDVSSYSVDLYRHKALFFRKKIRRGLGAWLTKLTGEKRQEAGTNKGMLVVAIRDESPAFQADLVPGDVIVMVDGQPTPDPSTGARVIRAAYGKKVDYAFLRRGERLTKSVLIPNGTW